MKTIWAVLVTRTEKNKITNGDNTIEYDWDNVLEELLAKISSYEAHPDTEKVREAYYFAFECHKDQKRKSGEPYFTHLVAVANILADKQLHSDIIIAALLHDSIEDTEGIVYKSIQKKFGHEIAGIVDGVTKITELNLDPTVQKQAANVQKLIVAVAKDDRVILVKLADRLHNLQTIEHLSPAKQRFKAKETMEFYAPIAELLGLRAWHDELEDLAFEILYPRARQSVVKYIEELRWTAEQKNVSAEPLMDQITKQLERMLLQKGLTGVRIESREKLPYSVWRKMRTGRKKVSSIFDLYGIRIITRIEDDVYVALGAIHNKWQALPNRFKDYISHPKPNGYRSVHTTVAYDTEHRVEFQIRTRLMHEVAETGIANHWQYKEGVQMANPYMVNSSVWKQKLDNVLTESSDKLDFLDHLREEINARSVFCYTPSFEVVWLSKNATILDYAYELNRDLGNRAISATIDGEVVQLDNQVVNGQVINIITAPDNYIDEKKKLCASTKKSQRYIEELKAELKIYEAIQYGRNTLRHYLEDNGKVFSEKAVRTAAEILKIKSGDELLRRIGNLEINSRDVLVVLYPDTSLSAPTNERPEQLILGIDKDTLPEMATCCYPLPGDRIIGFQNDDNAVTVHVFDCQVLEENKLYDRWIDLEWHPGPYGIDHPAKLDIVMSNRPGALGEVCTAIGTMKANIRNVVVEARTLESFHFQLEVEVNHLKHLYDLIGFVGSKQCVRSISRYQAISISSEYPDRTLETAL